MYAILLLAVVGILIQELLGGEYRTAYLTLTPGMSLTFIHISEFSQLAADDRMAEQGILITTDPLTGVASRFAYNRALQELDAAGCATVTERPQRRKAGEYRGPGHVRGKVEILPRRRPRPETAER